MTTQGFEYAEFFFMCTTVDFEAFCHLICNHKDGIEFIEHVSHDVSNLVKWISSGCPSPKLAVIFLEILSIISSIWENSQLMSFSHLSINLNFAYQHIFTFLLLEISVASLFTIHCICWDNYVWFIGSHLIWFERSIRDLPCSEVRYLHKDGILLWISLPLPSVA